MGDIGFMKLFAYTVLDDVKRAYELLENVDQDEQLFRIYWVTCIGLLRTISEVLKKRLKLIQNSQWYGKSDLLN